MNDAFAETCEVERQGMIEVLPFIGERALNGQFVVTNKGRLSKELQECYGDIFYNHSNGNVIACEIKSEMANRYGNFFLETWSNRSRFNLGWLYKLNTDLLVYYFIEEKDLYVINFMKLRQWSFGCEDKQGRIYVFPEKSQSKYSQLNDTWGRCVPINVILAEVGLKYFSLKQGEQCVHIFRKDSPIEQSSLF